MLLPAEFVNGFASIVCAGFGERLFPLRMVDRVGIILGFQRNTGTLTVVDATLAGFVQEIAGIQLNAGAVRMDSHGASGAGITQNSAGTAEDLKIVVIAALQNQRFVAFINILTDGLSFTEIKRRAFNGTKLAGGDVGLFKYLFTHKFILNCF